MKYVKRFDEYVSSNISKIKKITDTRKRKSDINENDKEFLFKHYYPKLANELVIYEIIFSYVMPFEEYLKLQPNEKEEFDNLEKSIEKELNDNTYLNSNSLTRKYLYDKIIDYIINNYDNRQDTYNTMRFKNILKKQWLVHLTDENKTSDIIKNGFIGVTDFLNLSYSGNLNERDFEGYGYAFTIPDIKKYKFIRGKYGHSAIVFKSSGIRLYHQGDKENQTVFYTKDATNINVIHQTHIYDKKTDTHISKFGIAGKEGIEYTKNLDYKNRSFIVFKDTFNECLDWLVENYEQYKKYLN